MQGRRRVAATSIDAYLRTLGAGQRAALERLRRSIQKAAPEAEESISYGLPAFRLHGRPLVAFGAATKHCSFYPMSPAVIEAHKSQLEAYETSKGTIRFPWDSPLPDSLVRKLVRARSAEITPGKEPAKRPPRRR